MMNESYMPIQSLDIEAESKITFDLFINLPLNNKFILYRRAGGQLESVRMESLAEKNLKNFFINKKDYAEFVKYVANRMKMLVSSEDKQENKKMMIQAAKAILSSTFAADDPKTTEVLMGSLTDICGNVIESVLESTFQSKSKRLYRNLVDLAARGTDFQKHPVNVASIAVMITCGIGYTTDRILADVAMAALLHDVGLSRIPPRLIPFSHRVHELNVADKRMIYSHPRLSLEVLQDKGISLSFVAKTMILQHHEDYGGTGYPNGVRGFSLNELAQVIRVADEIDNLFSQNETQQTLYEKLVHFMNQAKSDKIIDPFLVDRIRSVLL
jgi:HD-GYP domain-containing protein (c-di-GMP phosphodiesterase class II)